LSQPQPQPQPQPLKTAFITVGTTLFDNFIQNATNPIFLEYLVTSQDYRYLIIQFGKGNIPVVPSSHTSTVNEKYPSSTKSPPSNNNFNGKEEVWTGTYINSNGIALKWEAYRFRSSLANDMKRADLILSHAGAGSIMEGLTCARNQERQRQRQRQHQHQHQHQHQRRNEQNHQPNFHHDENGDGVGALKRKKVVVVINDLLMNNHQLELANALGARGHLFVMQRADMLLQKDALDQMERFIPKTFEGGDNLAFRQLADNFMGFSSESSE